jgi:hypothetical protein
MLRVLSLSVLFSAVAYSGVSVDIRVALGDFYRRPEREIIVLDNRRVPPDEMPVVLQQKATRRNPMVRARDGRAAGQRRAGLPGSAELAIPDHPNQLEQV